MTRASFADLRGKLASMPRDFYLFLGVIAFTGFSQSVFDSIFNNFLSERFALGNIGRTFLEVPRELPGFLVVFISGLFFFLCSRRLAALANGLAFVGLLLIAFFSKTFPVMLVWLFIYSMGQHIFMPLTSGIGMELASENRKGRRLGQFSSVGNITAILGSFAVFIGFKYLHLNFTISFIIAAFGFLIAAILAYGMKPDAPVSLATKFRLRREYATFYWLSILFGMRKQIFITFAPWVLVTVFEQKTQVIATLLTIGGVIGIFFKPAMGNLIDSIGERFILCGEAIILIIVCLGYGFSKSLFPGPTAILVVGACFIVDQLLMAVGMARATYLNKIALEPGDVQSTLTMGVTIDHVFSISVALASGAIWNSFGYTYVFLFAALIALINFFVALQVTTKRSLVTAKA